MNETASEVLKENDLPSTFAAAFCAGLNIECPARLRVNASRPLVVISMLFVPVNFASIVARVPGVRLSNLTQ